jgi:hypothetical protein
LTASTDERVLDNALWIFYNNHDSELQQQVDSYQVFKCLVTLLGVVENVRLVRRDIEWFKCFSQATFNSPAPMKLVECKRKPIDSI